MCLFGCLRVCERSLENYEKKYDQPRQLDGVPSCCYLPWPNNKQTNSSSSSGKESGNLFKRYTAHNNVDRLTITEVKMRVATLTSIADDYCK